MQLQEGSSSSISLGKKEEEGMSDNDVYYHIIAAGLPISLYWKKIWFTYYRLRSTDESDFW